MEPLKTDFFLLFHLLFLLVCVCRMVVLRNVLKLVYKTQPKTRTKRRRGKKPTTSTAWQEYWVRARSSQLPLLRFSGRAGTVLTDLEFLKRRVFRESGGALTTLERRLRLSVLEDVFETA